MNNRVLIIGGYGVFGGRLAIALSQTEWFDVLVAGRSMKKAADFCRETTCTPLEISATDLELEQLITAQNPGIVVDAAGPFQAYASGTYAVAEAAIKCGAHYLDLSDDADFTAGISALNGRASSAKVSVLSGASSVPALSSTVVGALAEGMVDIHLIESAILPGNRAPRGESVIRAIVGQVGKDMAIWRGGRFEKAKAWGNSKTIMLTDPDGREITKRWASLIGAPDLKLFPGHFNARSVLFRAGLDLKLMHGGLWLLSWPVRLGLFKNLLALVPILKHAANALEPFGSDLGGMVVSAEGKTPDGRFERRVWTLVARDGDGPSIPTIPAQLICQKLLVGGVKAGARPCLEAFSLEEAEAALNQLKITTSVHTTKINQVFETAMGAAFETLPDQIIDLHTVIDIRTWSGRAKVIRGQSLLSRIAGWFAGFPPATEDTDVTVNMRRTTEGETWIRSFGSKTFRSHLSAKTSGNTCGFYERFGWLKFKIDLQIEDGRLHYPVTSGRFLAVPLPGFLLPKSDTSEYVDDQGRAHFDVNISLPIAGHIVSYDGWITPDASTFA